MNEIWSRMYLAYVPSFVNKIIISLSFALALHQNESSVQTSGV